MSIPPPTSGQEGPDFRFTSLTQNERREIVAVAGAQVSGFAFIPANEFRLSALGADIDIDGTWKQTAKSNLAEWRHITSSGRDQYVRVVQYGYLFPLGHRAVTVEITDRVFAADPANSDEYADAYLQYKTFIRVTEPIKTYPATGQPFSANSWPFVSAQLLTLVTPDLDDAESTPALGSVPTPAGSYPQAFFPLVGGGNDVLWAVHLVDQAGTVVTVHMPLAFVYGEGGGWTDSQYTASQMQTIADAYNALGQMSTPSSRVTSLVSGTPIQYAPEVTTSGGTTHPGVTTHPTLALTLGAATYAKVPTLSPSDVISVPTASQPSPATLTSLNQPAFYPTLLTAQVRVRAAEALSRSSFDDPSGPGGVAITFYDNYVSGGFPGSLKPSLAVGRSLSPAVADAAPNVGSIYAALVNTPQLNFPSDAVGGISNPNLLVSGLSAAAGAIGGDLDQYANNATGLVEQYFGGLTSQLSNFLGGLPLGWLSQAAASGLVRSRPVGVTPDVPDVPMVPGILGDFLNDLGIPNLTETTDPSTGTVTVTYTLSVGLITFPSSDPIFQPQSDDGKLTLTGSLMVTESGTTTYKATGTMDPFTVTILGSDGALALIKVQFGDTSTGQPGVQFTAASGAKTNLQVNVGQTTFIGVLEFVNTLQEFLKDIGGSGLSIDVTPTQVSVSLSLALPSVGCGVFSLENLALSSSVVIPFLGGTTVATFAFCSQEQPFTLTVCMFGGGGYIVLGVGLTQVQSVTASLDFEGQFALDLGVASGSVSLVAGITFGYQVATGASLTGFVRICGEVEVLGIISISLEVDLSLTYDFSTQVMTGTATMTVSVSICFFSVSVGITVTKSFGGGSATPSIMNGSVHADAIDVASATNPFPTTTPTFEDMMPTLTDWSDYCAAFAA